MRVTDEMLNEQLRFKGKWIRKFFNFKSVGTFAKAQWLVKKLLTGKKTKKLLCEEKVIRKRDGAPLRICIYRPLHPVENATGLLWIHGGGYAVGVPEIDLGFIENFIAAADCIVVSPDYRVSLEEPYPAALEDCYEALFWMKEHAKELHIRADQLFVGGDSAGGGLTCAVTLYARDKNEVSIAFQMPLYPMIDDRMTSTSMRDNDAPIWNLTSNEIAWKLYLGKWYKTDAVPKYAAPSREKNFADLPPAFTFVGSIEPFYDETITYINNLQAADIPAEVSIFEGAFHGFDQISPKAEISREATQELLQKFRYAVKNYFKRQP